MHLVPDDRLELGDAAPRDAYEKHQNQQQQRAGDEHGKPQESEQLAS
jgi:hypothetical protein